MKKNTGLFDKLVRLILAAIFATLFFDHIVSGTLGIVLLVLAVIFTLTSYISYCPLYSVIGLTTRGKEKEV